MVRNLSVKKGKKKKKQEWNFIVVAGHDGPYL
jgi:hypothetical protein